MSELDLKFFRDHYEEIKNIFDHNNIVNAYVVFAKSKSFIYVAFDKDKGNNTASLESELHKLCQKYKIHYNISIIDLMTFNQIVQPPKNAVKLSDISTLRDFIDIIDEKTAFALHNAAASGNIDGIKSVIEDYKHNIELKFSSEAYIYEAIKALVNSPEDIWGQTALHFTMGLIARLQSNFSNVNLDSFTLEKYNKSINNAFEATKILLEKGANCDACNNRNLTPLDICIEWLPLWTNVKIKNDEAIKAESIFKDSIILLLKFGSSINDEQLNIIEQKGYPRAAQEIKEFIKSQEISNIQEESKTHTWSEKINNKKDLVSIKISDLEQQLRKLNLSPDTIENIKLALVADNIKK